MLNIKKVLLALSAFVTDGQCHDLLYKNDPIIQKSVQALACELEIHYPPRQDEAYRADAYHHISSLSQDKIGQIISGLAARNGIQDGRFSIAWDLLKSLYSKGDLHKNDHSVNTLPIPIVTEVKPENNHVPILLKNDSIEACKQYLRDGLTEEEIIKGRVQGNERAVLVVIGIANTMGKLLPLGMATVWQTLESLKQEILTEREQPKSSLISASNTVQDEMQEIAFSICLENLSVFPLREPETPYLRVLSLASETGININILHNAFYAALQQYVSGQTSKIRSMSNRQKQIELELQESELKLECAGLLSEKLTSDDLNDPDACDFAIALILSEHENLTEDILQKSLLALKGN